MDFQFHVAELLTLVSMAAFVAIAAIKVIRAADRVTGVLRDFPPHAHTPDGYILYPDGYAPPKVGSLSKKAQGASSGSE